MILDRFGNPFAVNIGETERQEQKDPLINIATGVVASDEATKDLLGVTKTGETCLINPIQAGGHNVPPYRFFPAVPKRSLAD